MQNNSWKKKKNFSCNNSCNLKFRSQKKKKKEKLYSLHTYFLQLLQISLNVAGSNLKKRKGTKIKFFYSHNDEYNPRGGREIFLEAILVGVNLSDPSRFTRQPLKHNYHPFYRRERPPFRDLQTAIFVVSSRLDPSYYCHGRPLN